MKAADLTVFLLDHMDPLIFQYVVGPTSDARLSSDCDAKC